MSFIKIAIKDLKIALSDKAALAILLLMPIILSTILSFALSGAFSSSGLSDLKIGIVNEYSVEESETQAIDIINKEYSLAEDNNVIGEAISQIKLEDQVFKYFFDADEIKSFLSYDIVTKEEGEKGLLDGDYQALVIFPEEYIRNSYTSFFGILDNEVNIEIKGNPNNEIKFAIVKQLMQSYQNEMHQTAVLNKMLIENNQIHLLSSFNIQKQGEATAKISEEIISTYNVETGDEVSSFMYYAAAISAMFMLFSVGGAANSMLDEKTFSTYSRMRVGGISKMKIILGKYFLVFFLCLIQILVLILYSTVVLGVKWGAFQNVFAVCVASSFAVAGLGIFIAAITFRSGSLKLSSAFQSVIIQFLALLGGSYIPVSLLPKFISNFSNIVPNGATLNAWLEIMQHKGFVDILDNIFILLITSVIFSVLAMLVFSEKEKNHAINIET